MEAYGSIFSARVQSIKMWQALSIVHSSSLWNLAEFTESLMLSVVSFDVTARTLAA